MKLQKTFLGHHSFMQDITRLKNLDVYQNMTHIYYEYQYRFITISLSNMIHKHPTIST